MSSLQQIKILDAVQLSEQHPTTFFIPTVTKCNSVHINSYIKAIFNFNDSSERMWLQVKDVRNTDNGLEYDCILDNNPFLIKNIQLGDDVIIKPHQIIQIMK